MIATHKKEIFVDKHSFARELEVYTNKIESQKRIKKEVRKYLPKYKIEKTFFNDVINNFNSALLKEYEKQNTLNLSAEKLAMLLDFDLTELKKYSSVYDKLKSVKSPSIDTFTTYAETDTELKKLSALENLINAIERVTVDTGIKAYPIEIERAFRRIITYNIRTNKYEINHRYIKDQKY